MSDIPNVGSPHAGRIGRYQIIKTLGEGSFGKVKLAYHMATHKQVALKIINRKTLAKSDMQGRVEREISYLRLLRHPHIIKLYDVIKSKDEIVMVIEFAGKELFDYIVQNGRMQEDEARRFFQQIISAVEYCHRHKIVHRDLKPENLLLDEKMNVKIADFGLSNIMTDGNFLKTSCGSPNYAAPEVISGKLYAGPEVDVWSCGVILYVMLCGKLPFDHEYLPALYTIIFNGQYTIPNFVSAGATNLLKRMLVVNPLDRITVHQIMEDPWFKVDIPEYLLPPEMEPKKPIEEKSEDIDDSLVGDLGRTMGYDKEQVYEALRDAKSNEGAEIRDAYSILQDNKKFDGSTGANDDDFSYFENVDDENTSSKPSDMTASSPQPIVTKGQKQSKGATPALTFDTHHMPHNLEQAGSSEANTIAVLPSSLPTFHRAKMAAMNSSSKKFGPLTSKKSKTRWHFGIRSRSYPLDVMGEIYRALKNLGAEWATPSEEDLWTIYVRWNFRLPYDMNGQSTVNNDEAATGDLMKMRIQLYQSEQDNYLVDFKFDGWEDAGKKSPEFDTFSAYPFLHFATRLIMELAVSGQAA